MMSFSKHAKGFPSSSDGHHFVRNMHEFRRENRFFVMFWCTCPIGLLTGMNDSSQATMDSPVTIGRGIIWTLISIPQWFHRVKFVWYCHVLYSNNIFEILLYTRQLVILTYELIYVVRAVQHKGKKWLWNRDILRDYYESGMSKTSEMGLCILLNDTIMNRPVSQMRATLAACRELALDYNTYP